MTIPLPDHPALAADRAMIGVPGSRWRLGTPALVIDLDALDRNIAAMAARCRAAGIALRPHAKTHKSARIARRQMDAGAVGVCVAKLGEAEALADHGIGDILVTSPVVSDGAIGRVLALHRRVERLALVVDDPGVLFRIGTAAMESGLVLDVLVDLDLGMHRTGVDPDRAVPLALAVHRHPFLRFAGLQAYQGQLQHLTDAGLRREHAGRTHAALARVRAAIEAEGVPVSVVTGGGTGTADIDMAGRVFTELQAGSYVFMDREYGEVPGDDGAPLPFETALCVQTTVISTNNRPFVTTDAGLKSFATDGPAPDILAGAPPGSTYAFLGDEQGAVLLPGVGGGAGKPSARDKLALLDQVTAVNRDPSVPRAGDLVPLGSVVTCRVPHCDPTVNLYAAYHVVRGDTLVDIWPVDARGRAQ